MPGLVLGTLHTVFLTPKSPSYLIREGIREAVWVMGEAAGLRSGGLGPRSNSVRDTNLSRFQCPQPSNGGHPCPVGHIGPLCGFNRHAPKRYSV